jgi:hypothetical protein
VDFGIKAFWWHITAKAMLRGVNEMLRIGWLSHQPSHAVDDVSTPVFHRLMVIVIRSHILESVYVPLPKSLITWHASYMLQTPSPSLKLGKRRAVFSSFGMLPWYVFLPFFFIPRRIYFYFSPIPNA